MKSKDISEFFAILSANNPNPKTELHFNSPFELLVAVVLSAQATDVAVNKATDKLFKTANTPEAIVALGETELKGFIKTIGLFNSKARHIIKLCAALIAQHNSQVPTTREALEALAGVGRKTANVVLNTAFGEPTMAVDTHIFRLGNRLKMATGKTPLAVEKRLLQKIPAKFLYNAHHWLILHGRYVCLARKPKCPECVVAHLCPYKNKTPPA